MTWTEEAWLACRELGELYGPEAEIYFIMGYFDLKVWREPDRLTPYVDRAIKQNPDVVEKIKKGKIQAIGKIIGDVMKDTEGRADTEVTRQLILDRLSV